MSKKKILVVDDDEALRDAYQFALADDYEVVLAVDGVDGVAKFDSGNPDMIFLDLRMPRLDGIGVLKHIRNANLRVPIYIVTAFAKEYMDELAKARDAGLVFEVASKPLNATQILSIARSILTDD